MIEISNLNFAYHATAVLEDVSLSITAGEFTGIIGPNGAGKSTLLKLIAGVFPPGSGQILLHQKSLAAYQRRELARLIGYIPQEFKTAFNFSAYEIVLTRFPMKPNSISRSSARPWRKPGCGNYGSALFRS